MAESPWAEKMRKVREAKAAAEAASAPGAAPAPPPVSAEPPAAAAPETEPEDGLPAPLPAGAPFVAIAEDVEGLVTEPGKSLLSRLLETLGRYRSQSEQEMSAIKALAASRAMADRIDAAIAARRFAFVRPEHLKFAQSTWSHAVKAAEQAGAERAIQDLKRAFLVESPGAPLESVRAIGIPETLAVSLQKHREAMKHAHAAGQADRLGALAAEYATLASVEMLAEDIGANVKFLEEAADVTGSGELRAVIDAACVRLTQRGAAALNCLPQKAAQDPSKTMKERAKTLLNPSPILVLAGSAVNIGSAAAEKIRVEADAALTRRLESRFEELRPAVALVAARAMAKAPDKREQAATFYREATASREMRGDWIGAWRLARESSQPSLEARYARIISLMRAPKEF